MLTIFTIKRQSVVVVRPKNARYVKKTGWFIKLRTSRKPDGFFLKKPVAARSNRPPQLPGMSLNPPPALLPVPLLANHPRLHAHLHESRQPRRPDAARRPAANDANLGECSPSWAGKSRARLGKTDSPIRLATPPEKLKDARRKHEEGRRSSGVQGREEMQAPGKKGWGQWREKSREEMDRDS
jgi:hypothetical protein